MDKPQDFPPMPWGNLAALVHRHNGVHTVRQEVCGNVLTLYHRDGDELLVGKLDCV